MKLNELKSAEGSRKVSKRVGRGYGSGLGKNCGTGHKGQNSRSGERRYKEVCPPSKPILTPPPLREFCPLCPVPQFLPKPEP